MAVPVVSLADLDVITGNRRRDRPPVLRGRGTDEIGALLDRAADLRQVGRSSGFAIQMMGSSDGEHLLYEAIMDTLGYASNRKPFRALALAVPVVLLSKLRHEPSATRLLALKAMLLNAGGLETGLEDRLAVGRPSNLIEG